MALEEFFRVLGPSGYEAGEGGPALPAGTSQSAYTKVYGWAATWT
jgi:hypothetical protein